MKRVAIILGTLLLSASLARAADEVTSLEAILKAWQGGDAPQAFRAPGRADQLVRYEIINAVYTRLNGVDAVLVNVLCVFPDRGPEKEITWRVVFRIVADPKAPDGLRITPAWRRFDNLPNARPSAPAEQVPALSAAQKAEAERIIAQLRNSKTHANAKDDLRDQLVKMGPAVLPVAMKELRTADVHCRLELCRLVERLNPPDRHALFGEELANAVSTCTKLVSRIQDDSEEAARYRDRAAKIKDPPPSSVGGLKFPPEQTEKASFLRLAASFDKKVVESRGELDGCADLLQLLCNYFASSGTDEDVPVLLGVVSDKGVTQRVPGWSRNVLMDNEHSQFPPVGFSTAREVNVAGQEQDWLPWGPVWGALRTLVTTRAGRPAVIECRDALEKAFVPLEKKRGGPWQQQALVTEFQRTERRVMARLEMPGGDLPPADAKPVDYAGDAREKLLAAIYGLAEKPGEDEWDKARRLARQAEMRRTAELALWHVVLKYAPGKAAAPMDAGVQPDAVKVVADPCFMSGAFDFAREMLPVSAFLEMRSGAGAAVTRLSLGTFDIPMRAAVADDIEKGKRRVTLELWCRMKVTGDAPRTLGAVTDLCIPIVTTRLLLRDDATNEVLYDRKGEPSKTPDKDPAPDKPRPRPANEDDDKDKVIEQ